MLCPKCNKHTAHRSHRRKPLEYLAHIFAIYPYRCKPCNHRFLRFRYEMSTVPRSGNSSAEREVVATRKSIQWKRKRREFILYAFGLGLFLAFLYFISRERSVSSDN